jgi:cytochrome c peroxidase
MKRWGLILALLGFLFTGAVSYRPPATISRAALGKKLFFEPMLSADSSVSCSSCHKPAFAFADTVAFSAGIGGNRTKRNVPSVLNMKNRPYFFWDGRAESLEAQALMPIQNPDEMGLPVAEAVKRLNQHKIYADLFQQCFHEAATPKNLGLALAAFEETLETVDSKFDDWSNNMAKLSASEERGRRLFVGNKARCFECHSEEDFTDDSFKSIGLFNGTDLNDSGQYLITGRTEDIAKFKVPGLRNVALTAPYMHNGQFRTLEEVIDYYVNPYRFVKNPQYLDPRIKRGLSLTSQDKKDLVAFLKTLSDRKYLKARNQH